METKSRQAIRQNAKSDRRAVEPQEGLVDRAARLSVVVAIVVICGHRPTRTRARTACATKPTSWPFRQ